MSEIKDTLYDLLPMVYRRKDAEQGWPLRALLRVVEEQVKVVENDIDQLYENWFIETCQDWVVPYIGDLVGYEPVHDAGEPGDISTEQALNRNKILIPRTEVANTLRNRRRKGTLALLELLASDVANWPARAVEFYRYLCHTQSLNHLNLERGRTIDLSRPKAHHQDQSPFDESAHTIDIRRPNAAQSRGRYNIPSIGLFVWRLGANSITKSRAYCLEKRPAHHFTFSALGNDIMLYTRPERETDPDQIAGELNVPTPIRRQALFDQNNKISDLYYGEGKSIAIYAKWPKKVNKATGMIPATSIVPADLSGWNYSPSKGLVAVDPELGRIAFPPLPQNQLPEIVWASYYYGSVADIGGGEYDRPIIEPSSHYLSLSIFKSHDLLNAKALVARLSESDMLGKYIFSRFSSALQNRLNEFNARQQPKEPDESLVDSIAHELNLLRQIDPSDESPINPQDNDDTSPGLVELDNERENSKDNIRTLLKEKALDAIKGLLRDRLAGNIQKQLDRFFMAETPEEPPDNLVADLAAELSDAIQMGPFDEAFVALLDLNEEMKSLFKKLYGSEINKMEIIRLNRLLLETAFPNEIIKSYGFYRIGFEQTFRSLESALDAWQTEKPRSAVIEIVDSDVYTPEKSVQITFEPHQELQIRAALKKRPSIRLLDLQFSGYDAIAVQGAPGSRFSLDGLLIFGRGIYLENQFDEINIRHCTLVPGWELEPSCTPKSPTETSLRLVNTDTRLDISHSIVGTIDVQQPIVDKEPIHIVLSDSILDSTDERAEALSAGGCNFAHAVLSVYRSTVIGHVHTHAIELGENSIFDGIIQVARRQIGCLRFCYITPVQQNSDEQGDQLSRTPRRYHCQPDLVQKAVNEKIETGEISKKQGEQLLKIEQSRVRPHFESKRYCQANYCRLADSCADEIKKGADDESEMGVYHDLYQPQREANLRTRLEEYTPAGMDVGIFYAS